MLRADPAPSGIPYAHLPALCSAPPPPRDASPPVAIRGSTVGPAKLPPGWLGRAFDATAMWLTPVVARVLGYQFRSGCDDALARDGHLVHSEVWRELGVSAPADLEHIGRRYDDATRRWIVAYHRGRPVGVMALLDPSRASPALDYGAHALPPDLDAGHTAEIARLAVLRTHRGGAQTVMIGLLREMLAWSTASGVTLLLAGAKARLFPVYARYNPTARRIDPPLRAEEDPDLSRYYAQIRAYGGEGVVFTFEVAGATPWNVFSRYLRRRLRPRGSR